MTRPHPINIARAVSRVATHHAQRVSERTDALRCHHCDQNVSRADALRVHVTLRHALAAPGQPKMRRVLASVCPRCAQRHGLITAPRPTTRSR